MMPFIPPGVDIGQPCPSLELISTVLSCPNFRLGIIIGQAADAYQSGEPPSAVRKILARVMCAQEQHLELLAARKPTDSAFLPQDACVHNDVQILRFPEESAECGNPLALFELARLPSGILIVPHSLLRVPVVTTDRAVIDPLHTKCRCPWPDTIVDECLAIDCLKVIKTKGSEYAKDAIGSTLPWAPHPVLQGAWSARPEGRAILRQAQQVFKDGRPIFEVRRMLYSIIHMYGNLLHSSSATLGTSLPPTMPEIRRLSRTMNDVTKHVICESDRSNRQAYRDHIVLANGRIMTPFVFGGPIITDHFAVAVNLEHCKFFLPWPDRVVEALLEFDLMEVHNCFRSAPLDTAAQTGSSQTNNTPETSIGESPAARRRKISKDDQVVDMGVYVSNTILDDAPVPAQTAPITPLAPPLVPEYSPATGQFIWTPLPDDLAVQWANSTYAAGTPAPPTNMEVCVDSALEPRSSHSPSGSPLVQDEESTPFMLYDIKHMYNHACATRPGPPPHAICDAELGEVMEALHPSWKSFPRTDAHATVWLPGHEICYGIGSDIAAAGLCRGLLEYEISPSKWPKSMPMHEHLQTLATSIPENFGISTNTIALKWNGHRPTAEIERAFQSRTKDGVVESLSSFMQQFVGHLPDSWTQSLHPRDAADVGFATTFAGEESFVATASAFLVGLTSDDTTVRKKGESFWLSITRRTNHCVPEVSAHPLLFRGFPPQAAFRMEKLFVPLALGFNFVDHATGQQLSLFDIATKPSPVIVFLQAQSASHSLDGVGGFQVGPTKYSHIGALATHWGHHHGQVGMTTFRALLHRDYGADSVFGIIPLRKYESDGLTSIEFVLWKCTEAGTSGGAYTDQQGLSMDFYLSAMSPVADTAAYATDAISLPLTVAPSRIAPSARQLATSQYKNIEPKFRFEARAFTTEQVRRAQ